MQTAKQQHIVFDKKITQIYCGFSLTSQNLNATIETIGVKP
jgi:hypothetical protein